MLSTIYTGMQEIRKEVFNISMIVVFRDGARVIYSSDITFF